MATAASTSLRISINNGLLMGQPCSRTNLLRFPPHFSSSPLLTFARRRSNHHTSASSFPNKNKPKRSLSKRDAGDDDDDLDEDAFEALFNQLEEDLKNDGLSLDDDDDDDHHEISEEELADLERELEEALKDDKLSGYIESVVDEDIIHEAEEEEEEEKEEDEDEEDDGEVVAEVNGDEDYDEDLDGSLAKLKNWQLKRLAYALKSGRRKTPIKNLAADLCLDRAVVLKLLRDPPPRLVLLSATLPDKPISTTLEPLSSPLETVPLENLIETEKTKTKVEMPVHEMQRNQSAKKRIKKKHLSTLEQVYGRSRRPTNAMISSIVHVTNLPRARVVKWFEDRRAQDGVQVPDRQLPYRRSSVETSLS